jgi:hypothetical protein
VLRAAPPKQQRGGQRRERLLRSSCDPRICSWREGKAGTWDRLRSSEAVMRRNVMYSFLTADDDGVHLGDGRTWNDEELRPCYREGWHIVVLVVWRGKRIRVTLAGRVSCIATLERF